jgi:hypothetical protein
MRKSTALSLLAVMALTMTTGAANADDNKIVAGAKTLGKGIMWGPKKLAVGLKKGATAMGNGAKKLVGK